MIPDNVEKRGVVEDIGTARDSKVFIKLNVRKNHPNPNATIPPAISKVNVFLRTFKKPRSLSIMGAEANNETAIAVTRTVLMAKARSKSGVSFTAMLIIDMLTDHNIAVAKAATTPITTVFFCVSATHPPSFRLTSHIPKTIVTAPRTTCKVTGSPTRKTTHKRLNSGYVHVIGTARTTPISFKLIIYNVSPKPKPITPLTHARTIVYTGKLIKTPNLPITTKNMSKTTLVHVRRTMFAEIGFAFNNASLYSIADIVQQSAAPKAASSPIIVSRNFPEPLEKTILF